MKNRKPKPEVVSKLPIPGSKQTSPQPVISSDYYIVRLKDNLQKLKNSLGVLKAKLTNLNKKLGELRGKLRPVKP
jgi:hypothetical protein